jgi:MFS family permease
MGFGIGVLSFAPSWPVAAVGAFFVGLGQLTQSSGILSLVQTRAPAHLRGRLLGVFTTVFVGLTPFGALAASFAAEHWTVWVAQRGLSVVMMLGACVYLIRERNQPSPTGEGSPIVPGGET